MKHLTGKVVLIALILSNLVCFGQSPKPVSPNDRLFSKIYGCDAAVTIANAIGEPVEGWPWWKIEMTYGFLDRFVASTSFAKERVIPQRFGQDWVYHAYYRENGWTEDGMERYKLLSSAITKKGGRINIEELAREWIEKIDPSKFGYNLGPQDMIIYNLLKAGMPPWEVGRYAIWPGFMGTSKMIIPIGIVNACRPDNAARDALDLARIKDVQGRPIWRDDKYGADGALDSTLVWDCGPEVAAAIAAATAEALRPEATVNSVVESALAQLPAGARKDVEMAVAWARNAKDWKEIRPLYDKYYEGKPISNGVEILAGGLACFVLADGRPREAILYAINLGRDTDCKAYVAGGLAGALRGIDAIPPEWVQTVEKAVLTDPYTVSRLTSRHNSEGLYRACLNEMRKAKTSTTEIELLLTK